MLVEHRRLVGAALRVVTRERIRHRHRVGGSLTTRRVFREAARLVHIRVTA